MNKTKFEKLKTLDVPELGEWPNYLEYGFDKTDIDKLLAIVKENNSISGENDDSAYEAIHAWRVLGQLGDIRVIQPLISTLNQFSISDDDWALAELPLVFGMLGEKAIKPLADYLRLRTNEEYARVMASDGLNHIYKEDNSLKLNIIDAYSLYLRNPDERAYSLNGLLVASIMDMKATELIEFVYEIFKKGIVDTSICGDIEDVEIALGMISSRSTEKPNYMELGIQFHKENLKKKTEEFKSKQQYIDYFDSIFNKYANKNTLKNSIELDGFLAACVCSDEEIIPSQWSQDIWGKDKDHPLWESQDQFEKFNNCILDYFKDLENNIEIQVYEPLLQSDNDAELWCKGFMKGINYWHKSPEDFSVPTAVGYGTIAIMASDKNNKLSQELDLLQGAENLSDKISFVVTEIYNEMHQLDEEFQAVEFDEPLFSGLEDNYSYQAKQPFVRDSKKVGRNEKCPCGSGKKYKKCCLRNL